jgi:hypothetical protein
MIGTRSLVLLTTALVLGCGEGVRVDEQRALQKGMTIARTAGETLKGRLQAAMAEGGPAHAVEVCSSVAQHLMDSLAQVHGARIRRVSHRVRNPAGQPDARDMRVLEDYLGRIRAGEDPAALEVRVSAEGDSVHYHQPILITSPLCLVCHGAEGEGLDPGAYAAIQARYPEDQAVGFAPGELRGIWSIRWKR